MKATATVRERSRTANRTSRVAVVPRKALASTLIERGPIPNPLKWAGSFIENWEILIYDRVGYWEACFFKWGEHHEHLSASSFDEALAQATKRIHALE